MEVSLGGTCNSDGINKKIMCPMW